MEARDARESWRWTRAYELKGHRGAVYNLKFGDGEVGTRGRVLASAAFDGVRLWAAREEASQKAEAAENEEQGDPWDDGDIEEVRVVLMSSVRRPLTLSLPFSSCTFLRIPDPSRMSHSLHQCPTWFPADTTRKFSCTPCRLSHPSQSRRRLPHPSHLHRQARHRPLVCPHSRSHPQSGQYIPKDSFNLSHGYNHKRAKAQRAAMSLLGARAGESWL